MPSKKKRRFSKCQLYLNFLFALFSHLALLYILNVSFRMNCCRKCNSCEALLIQVPLVFFSILVNFCVVQKEAEVKDLTLKLEQLEVNGAFPGNFISKLKFRLYQEYISEREYDARDEYEAQVESQAARSQQSSHIPSQVGSDSSWKIPSGESQSSEDMAMDTDFSQPGKSFT